MQVAIEAGGFRPSADCRCSYADDLLDGVEVAIDVEVGPAVVVVIEEPGGEAEDRLLHAGLFRDFSEGAVVVVAVEEVGAVEVGDVEVSEAVVVVIGGGDSFAEGDLVNAGSMGDVFKCAVAAIVKELGRSSFVGDEEIEEAIVVDVGPDGGLAWRYDHVGQTALPGDVSEGAVAVIAQQGLAHAELPAAAEDKQVHAAVVVVVGGYYIEAAELIGEASLGGAVGEGAVAVVVVVAQRVADIGTGDDDVEIAVVVEVLNDGSRAIGACSGRRRRRGRGQCL